MRRIGSSGRKTTIVTSVSCQEYTAITPRVATIRIESTIQATAPHSVNCAIVSTSLVTARHERAASVVDVLGHREAVDVGEGAHPQPEQAGLGGPDEPQERGAAHDVERHDQDGDAAARSRDEAGPVAAVAEHAPVEDLLDQDGHGQLADRGGHRQHGGERQTLPQLGGDGKAAAEHLDGAGVREGVLLRRRRSMACARGRGCRAGPTSASTSTAASWSSDRRVDGLAGRAAHAASCS